ncbi:MAG: histidine phosphotransferase family protein [Rickettsiales bacterium]|nr:histidine phosphotransferase family protein [Pseudomonadota bacterium]MDA0966537.1 histidine phosphotransferase family protein [Pseudomonadota bacterium]MDG4543399.1 histidine phosphotransferase family protein [Rickettsiales bacterium]MDG4546641.1 histidine phosphotransferase family protein [Rickettsiales bacterium]MDG4548114.1 histidine phosphotransferase family protein [Rickettsiales bacterium]
MISDLELSELIAVKLCHDLAGPVGAINNGTELLKEANAGIYEQSLELVETSAKDAVVRILLYRQAYGTIGSNGHITIDKLNSLTSNYYNSGKVVVKFTNNEQPISIDAGLGKAILNMIMLIEKTMLYGGVISVSVEMKNNKTQCSFKAEGRAIKVNEDHLEILQNGDGQIKVDVKNIQAYLVWKLMGKLNMKTKVSVKEDLLEIKML